MAVQVSAPFSFEVAQKIYLQRAFCRLTVLRSSGKKRTVVRRPTHQGQEKEIAQVLFLLVCGYVCNTRYSSIADHMEVPTNEEWIGNTKVSGLFTQSSL